MTNLPPLLVITRPAPGAARFAAQVQAAFGREVATLFSPALAIRALPDAKIPAPPAAVIFTSAQAPACASALGLHQGPAWCVGDRTMQAATAAGFSARSAGGDVEDLIALILKEKPGGLLLHLSGTHTRGDVAGRLQAAGLHCTNVAVYEQVDQPPTPAFLAAMAGEAPLVVPLFSARSAGALAGLRPKGACHVIAMSQAVADAVVVDDRILTTCAPVPTEAAMIATTIKTLEMLEQVAQ